MQREIAAASRVIADRASGPRPRATTPDIISRVIKMLAAACVLTLAIAPNFDTFLTNSLGRWRGASYMWQLSADSDGGDFLPLGVAPGYITAPTAASTEVTEVMRSCGGAVQGVKEERQCQPSDGEVTLNRQIDGTTFFSYGSWSTAPVRLSSAEESDMLTSPTCFGLSVCLAHADETRRRLLVVVSEMATILCCDVAVEVKAGGVMDGEENAATALLDKRLQCVVDAKAWEGGATRLTLSGTPQGGGDWLNARTKWVQTNGDVAGGAPLVPAADGADVAYLPSGCWVRVAGGEDGGVLIEVGSLSVDSAEVKAISHEYAKDGDDYRLSRVLFEKIEAAADEYEA